MRRPVPVLLWMAPLMLYSLDAQAWGLSSHVYFAQWLTLALPFADPRLRRAVAGFPQLVMGGACLPDLALISRDFPQTHQWRHVQRLLARVESDQDTAIAVGYASHLLADVMAHNHFVPAHEAMWLKRTLFTHVTSEWALDAHLAPLTAHAPGPLLASQQRALADFLCAHFGRTAAEAERALSRLARADRLLRGARLPQLLYAGFRRLDRRLYRHFVYYVSQTQQLLQELESVLDGALPAWEPDPRHGAALKARLRRHSRRQLGRREACPILLLQPFAPAYSRQNDSLASTSPSAAPASTSLG